MKCENKSWAVVVLWGCLTACGGTDDGEQEVPQGEPTCSTLFGMPGENTGLTKAECMPVCAECQAHGAFTAPSYSSEDLLALREIEHLNPPELLGTSPYETPEDFPAAPGEVCAILLEDDGYRLESYSDADEAEAAGARVTHEGACGACSSLRDLAVYIEVPDLTTPVRRCGVQNIAGTVDDLSACIADVGFSPACAEIWAYNSQNTREECLDDCVALLNAPYHDEDGAPNACIQCDEDKSGPVFKAVAGRTRRNSGLPTALCRPCEGLAMLDHHYFTD